ncbi:hypothetical protein Z517_09373 [Fonsecaea pedrosoi CBS 271.37]|uniref:Unplaced genomic scaffold supercont1.6, whole genome shotgun sequence n=1 Tax=Fonsecaea pedrosoi CBS 271.37 TaxID=1442368 RepID=A0A0D2GX74_9EURO|nr:uncharacterized protein Z517_09373 [Fonsecaea pedrosoi CBS 271.37]KIW76929.1 hypothetical protein Z517_09373 [Fonsecaea pedrosoi CBS 271.37]
MPVKSNGSNAGGSKTGGSNTGGSNTGSSNAGGSNAGATISYRFTYTTCPLHEYSKISAVDGRGPIWFCEKCTRVHTVVWQCTLCGHNPCPSCQHDSPQVDGIEATNRTRYR